MRPSSRSFRNCSDVVYHTHSTMSLSHVSAPYSSTRRIRSSFENVFSRQKISPTTPISGAERSRRAGTRRNRSRHRVRLWRMARSCTGGSVVVDSMVRQRSSRHSPYTLSASPLCSSKGRYCSSTLVRMSPASRARHPVRTKAVASVPSAP